MAKMRIVMFTEEEADMRGIIISVCVFVMCSGVCLPSPFLTVNKVEEIFLKPGEMSGQKFLKNYLQKGRPFLWKVRKMFSSNLRESSTACGPKTFAGIPAQHSQ